MLRKGDAHSDQLFDYLTIISIPHFHIEDPMRLIHSSILLQSPYQGLEYTFVLLSLPLLLSFTLISTFQMMKRHTETKQMTQIVNSLIQCHMFDTL